jgi:hypothetical protein
VQPKPCETSPSLSAFSPEACFFFAQAPAKFEAKKYEGLAISGLKTSELYDTGLFRRQHQVKFPQTLAHVPLHILKIAMVLKATYIVVSESHQQRISTALWFHNLLKPQIKHVMQVDVSQHG